jgi:hypothetical protein
MKRLAHFRCEPSPSLLFSRQGDFDETHICITVHESCPRRCGIVPVDPAHNQGRLRELLQRQVRPVLLRKRLQRRLLQGQINCSLLGPVSIVSRAQHAARFCISAMGGGIRREAGSWGDFVPVAPASLLRLARGLRPLGVAIAPSKPDSLRFGASRSAEDDLAHKMMKAR